MATTTTKLALTKPDGTDLVDIAVLNANADKLDLAAGAFTCTSSTRPATPWNGQLIFETDTNNFYVYISSSAVWLSVGGAVISTTKPTTAGRGNFWMDPDTMKVYIYYVDANSSQWVEVGGGSTEIPTAANATARDAMYPSPVQGNTVFRNDLGINETYYGLYNVTTNPGGRDVAGWYTDTRAMGLVPIRPSSVVIASGSGSANALGQVSFTGATSLSLDGIFSDTYINYLIKLNVTGVSGSVSLRGILRKSGADLTANTYFSAHTYTVNTTSTQSFDNISPNTFFSILGVGSAAHEDLHVYNPFTVSHTYMKASYASLSGDLRNGTSASMYLTNASADGIKIQAASNNFSGFIQVFGYND